MKALVGFLVDVFKVFGLMGFSLACTLLAHAVANRLVSMVGISVNVATCVAIGEVRRATR